MVLSAKDRRIQMTNQLLKDALLTLTEDRPVESITTSELCRAAGVSRNTFYSHFRDPVDLFQKMLEEFQQDLKERIYKSAFLGELKQAAREACRIVKEEPILSRNYLEQSQYRDYLREVLNKISEEMMQSFLKEAPISDNDKIMLFQYMSSGTAAMLIAWIYQGFREPEEIMAERIYRYNYAMYDSIAGITPNS